MRTAPGEGERWDWESGSTLPLREEPVVQSVVFPGRRDKKTDVRGSPGPHPRP